MSCVGSFFRAGAVFAFLGLVVCGCSSGGGSGGYGLPPGPGGVTATPGCTQVLLDWSPVPGADSYTLYWSNAPGVWKRTGTPIPGVTPPYVHAGLANGTPYHYVVTFTDAGIESRESVEVAATPLPLAAPVGVTATGTGCSEITIDWNPVPGASWYDIYWSAIPGVTKATGTPIPGVLPPYLHVDTNLVPGTPYYYVVVAAGAVCESPESAEVAATPPASITPQGTLDTTFGGQGWVFHDGAAGPGYEQASSITLDAAGRILVAGRGENGVIGDFEMVIWRYNPDGTLDTTFNGQGWVTHDNAAGGSSYEEARDIALDAAGRILVTGCSMNAAGDYDMVIWRYNPGGSLDTSFDGRGWVVHNDAAGGNGSDHGFAITLDARDRIVVSGQSANPASDFEMAIWRYNRDGSLDTTFNGQGWVTHGGVLVWGPVAKGPSDVAIDPSGKVLVAGHGVSAAGDCDMAIWRYNQDGSLDTTFNGQGWVTHDNAAGGSGDDVGVAIALDVSGRILVAGSSQGLAFGGAPEMVIWRYDSMGGLDTTFGGQGWVVDNNPLGVEGCEGRDVALDAAGRIVVAGYGDPGAGGLDMVIWRYNRVGTLDTTFDGRGWVAFDNTTATDPHDIGHALALDPCGRILVAGRTHGPSYDMAIWRYR